MKKVVLFIVSVLVVSAAAAQDDISKQMEVTKAYTPKVGRADKLPVEPRMVDTVKLRPGIEYSITPTAWRTAFGSEKYNPASMSVVPFERNRPLYLRAGVGYPLQSTADLYFNPYMGNKSTFGMFFNHRGSYSKIKNEIGVKPNSTEMYNGVGLYGSKYNRRNRVLSGDLWYDNRLYNMYGYYSPTNAPNGIRWESLNWGRVNGSIAFGDTFADMSRFNFQVGLDGGYTHMKAEDVSQGDLDIWARMGGMFNSRHGLEGAVREQFGVTFIDYGGAMNNSFSTTAFDLRYILSLNKFRLKAGLDLYYIYNDHYSQNDIKLRPSVEATFDIAKGYFTPYLTATSRIMDGSLEGLSRVNPYIFEDGMTGLATDLRVGFMGDINSIFSYKLSGGVSWLQDYALMFNTSRNSSPVMFRPVADDGMLYTVGAELGLNNLGGFWAKLYANWYKYDFDTVPVATGLPNCDAGLELGYTHKKFAVKAGAELTGKRKFIESNSSSIGSPGYVETSRPGAVDLSLGFEYNVSDNFGVFIEGRNLANQKLYPYNHYRGLGANVMVGIKATF